MTVNQPTAAPTRKVKAAIWGAAAGLPIGTYFSNVILGIVNAASPELYQSLQVADFQAGLAGLITTFFIIGAAYATKESA